MTTDRRPVGVILNPAAGGGKAIRLLPRVAASLRELGETHHIHVTAAPGEAIGVAQRFAKDGMRLVIAIGGDGTINEVVNGLLKHTLPSMVALGIVPAGRGADFARMFRWPTEPEAALARACQVVPRAIDVGIATFDDGSSRYFLNIAGVGFDAMVAEQATASRLPGAFAPYLSGIVSALVSNLHQEMTVETNGTRFAGPMMSVVAANGQYFGGGFNIVPAARVDDGLLNLAIIGALSPFALLRELPRVYRGAHTDHPGFTHLTASTIRVETAGAARVELDGEVIGSAPVTFSLKPGALCLAD